MSRFLFLSCYLVGSQKWFAVIVLAHLINVVRKTLYDISNIYIDLMWAIHKISIHGGEGGSTNNKKTDTYGYENSNWNYMKFFMILLQLEKN